MLVLAGEELSHSTNQTGGKVQGQVNPAIISSNESPKNNVTSKAEYTNTQQDLRVQWIYLVHLTRHARLFSSGVSFAEKQQRVYPYIQI